MSGDGQSETCCPDLWDRINELEAEADRWAAAYRDAKLEAHLEIQTLQSCVEKISRIHIEAEACLPDLWIRIDDLEAENARLKEEKVLIFGL